MPTSIKEEFEKLQQSAISGDFLTTITELDKLLERKDLSLEDKLYLKLFKSEVISGLNQIGLDGYTYEEGIKLAEEVVQKIGEIDDEYLRIGAYMILGTSYLNVYNYAKAIETYEHNKPKFRKLKPISGIFYLRLQALDYILEGMVPLLKTYIDENATDAEKAKGFQLTMKSERFCEENNLISYQIASLNNIATMQYFM